MILTVGENEAYQSIGAALAAAKENDVVVVRGGVYHEAIVLSTPGVSVVAADGETAAIDGRYSPALFGDGNYAMSNGRKVGAGQLPSLAADNARRGGWVYSGGNLNINGYSSLVRLVGNGTSISGVTLRNSAGRFIVVEGNDCTIEDCRMDFCYGGAISIARGTVGAVLRRLTVTRSSVKHFDEGAPGAGPDAVATTVICAGTDALIEGNTIAYNYGEGISADKGSVRPVVRNNVIHTNYHWCLGFNNTNGAALEGNIVYWCDNLIEAMDKENPADGFVGGSELASPENPREALAPNMRIVGNLFVGALKRAWLLGSTGRPVQFVDSLIAENTIIGRATPGKPGHTFTWTELKSAPHVNTTVAENVILWEPDTQGISYQAGGGVTWRDNLYSAQPPSGMRSDGDIVTREAVLANPFTPIVGQYDAYAPDMPDTATTFDIDNYRPLAGGAAVGRGALAVEPAEPPVEPPTDPEPPGEWVMLAKIDYDEAIAALRESREALDAALILLGEDIKEF